MAVLNYQGYMVWKSADGSESYFCPYTNNEIEEVGEVLVSRDHIHPNSSAANHSLGRVRYSGSITFPLCVEMVSFLKDWFVTNRYHTSPYRRLEIDNGLKHYTYTRMYPDSWELSCTAEGLIQCTINVLGRGQDADDRLRLEQDSTSFGYADDLFNIHPIPWYKCSFVASGEYTWQSSYVTSWNISISNNYHEGIGGDDKYVAEYFDMGNLEADGSTTLYAPDGIEKPEGTSTFQVVLSLPQTVQQVNPGEGDPGRSHYEFASPTAYLTFPVCVATTIYPDAGGGRSEFRTRTIDFICKRNGTYLAVY